MGEYFKEKVEGFLRGWISMFQYNKLGNWEFKFGKEAYKEAERASLDCSHFTPDDEDEQVADELRSCYNCAFRRWTSQSFVCMKK